MGITGTVMIKSNENSITTWQLLNILQVCDSAFPIGSFNHSYGMESYLRENVICDAHTFNRWLTMFFENQYLYNEGLAIKLVYEILEKDDILLILGKGHEDYQIIGHVKHHFDDAEIVRDYIKSIS